MDGFRAAMEKEFASVHVFNLRGNARTQGELRRKEAENVFDIGSRTPVAITLLVKKQGHRGRARIYYHDIGDYLSREDKLTQIAQFGDYRNVPWVTLEPDKKHDWINHRDDDFEAFMAIGDKSSDKQVTVFSTYSRGVATSRDAWVYNFSYQHLTENVRATIDFYNQQVDEYKAECERSKLKPDINAVVSSDSKKISWSRGLKNDAARRVKREFTRHSAQVGVYRPYCKQWVYFNKHFNDMVYRMPRIFPEGAENLAISVTGLGVNKDFSCLVVNKLPDVQLLANGQCFPLYHYEAVQNDDQMRLPGLDMVSDGGYVRRDAITDAALDDFRQKYGGASITKEDIFYYVYGILHSPEYRQRFEADLKKSLPRIPFAQDFLTFSKAGRDLAQWHLSYESVEPYPLEERVSGSPGADPKAFYRVVKMTFGKRDGKPDRTTVIYNDRMTLVGVPLEAYDYVVNGKSAIEWIMDQYRVKTDKDSGIVNDPNEWSDDPRYILDLLKRIVRVSLETIRIVDGLPPLNEAGGAGGEDAANAVGTQEIAATE